jgi:hypothetical protein
MAIALSFRVLPALLAATLAAASPAAAEPARFRVTDAVAAPPTEGITATIGAFGSGSSLMRGGMFEPVFHRDWIMVTADAPPDAPGRLLAGYAALSRWNTLRDGALDGAEVEVMRLTDGRIETVRRGRVPPGGHALSDWLPVPGGQVVPGAHDTTRVPVAQWERPDQPRWYMLRAVDRAGRLSEPSAPAQLRLPPTLAKPDENAPSPRERLEHDPGAAPAPDGPAAPTGLAARYDPRTGSVVLTWDAVSWRDAPAGYAVYHSYVPPERMRGVFLDVDGEGEPIRAGDWAVLRATRLEDTTPESFVSDRVWGAGPGRALRPGPVGEELRDDPAIDWRLVAHPEGTERPGNRSHLRVEIADRSTAFLRRYNHSGTAQDWFEVLRPGVRYVLEGRIRGDRPGRALLRVTGPLGREVRPQIADYGTEWTEFSLGFVPPRLLEGGQAGEIGLELQGPGRIDVDDLRFRRADLDWLDYAPESYARLAEAGVSSLRTHGWIKTGTGTYDLAGLLDGGTVPGTTAPDMFHTLSMMERADMRPWLQIEPHFTRDEWLGLVEYLAAPFEPGVHDPAERPWAALRARQGRAAPWTDAFDALWFEIGNETWNRLFAPWIFPVLTDAATGREYGTGAVYGLYQARVAEILRSSPHWDAALERKLSFVIGGWQINDYGTAAARMAPEASDVVTVAAYNGGWDQGEGPVAGGRDDYARVMAQLLQTNLPRAARHVAELGALAARQGREILVGTYEAGPGYAMDGLNGRRVTPAQAAEQEVVMKSRAAGVATLDGFLGQRLAGFGTQNFFTFSDGVRWSSHAQWHEGGDPYPAWSLLALMSRLGGGEMLAVETGAVPRRDLPAEGNRPAVRDAPMVALYATRDAGRLVLWAVSRRIPGYPDPASDGCTPVEIALPEGLPEGPVTLLRTGGAFDDSGADGGPPPIEQVDVPRDALAGGTLSIGAATGAPDCGLPGAAAYVYVIGDPPPT